MKRKSKIFLKTGLIFILPLFFLFLFSSGIVSAADCQCNLADKNSKCTKEQATESICISGNFVKNVVIPGQKFSLLDKVKVSKTDFSVIGAKAIFFDDILINYSSPDFSWTDNKAININLDAGAGLIKGGYIFNQPGLKNQGAGGNVTLKAKTINVKDIGTEGHRAPGGNIVIFGDDITTGTLNSSSIDGIDLRAAGFNVFGKAGYIIIRGNNRQTEINSFKGDYIFAQGVSPAYVIIKAKQSILVKNGIYNFSGCSVSKICDFIVKNQDLCKKDPVKNPYRYNLTCSPSEDIVLQASGKSQKIILYGADNDSKTELIDSSNKIYSGENKPGVVSLFGEQSVVHLGPGGISSLGDKKFKNNITIVASQILMQGKLSSSGAGQPYLKGKIIEGEDIPLSDFLSNFLGFIKKNIFSFFFGEKASAAILNCDIIPPPLGCAGRAICVSGACVFDSQPGPSQCYTSADCASHNECLAGVCATVFSPGINQCTTPGQSCGPFHNICLPNGNCMTIPGPGTNECSGNTCGTHKICQACQCVSVSGPGIDQCSGANDCSQARNICNAGRCILVSGVCAVPNSCSTDFDCGLFHTECQNNSCVLVSGGGLNNCLTSIECGLYHKTCSGNSCINVPGPGMNLCSSDPDCSQKHTVCGAGICFLISGSGTDQCVSNRDCNITHSECIGNSCISVMGLGTNSCISDSDCGASHYACVGSSCQSVAGPGPNLCIGVCAGFHSACVNQSCTFVVGAGTNQCLSNSDCAASHSQCMAGSCVSVPGPGVNTCINDSTCGASHKACSSGTCVSVSGSGPDLCLNPGSDDCFGFHNACVNQSCVLVFGAGTNQCESNSDCGPYHNVCSNGSCVSIQGSGNNLCLNSSECLNRHTVCQNQTCALTLGSDDNQCVSNSDCGGFFHTECQANTCVLTVGSGINQCSSSFECASQNHLICQNQVCSSVPGAGSDLCSVSPDNCANKHTVCSNQTCIVADGAGLDQCSGNSDCGFFHTECQEGSCVQVPGAGVNQCTNSDSCNILNNYRCFREQCRLISLPEAKLCAGDTDCSQTHNECSGEKCIAVSGQGSDQCVRDSNCVNSRKACVNNSCVSVSEPGPDQCLDSNDCQDRHNECQNYSCVSVSGAGTDLCSSSSDCLNSFTKCNSDNTACEIVHGNGISLCINNADCGDTNYNECEAVGGGWICSQKTSPVPLSLPNQCLQNSDCLFGNCGNGNQDYGEECGEPGLSCSGNKVCSYCQCLEKINLNRPPFVLTPSIQTPENECCVLKPSLYFSWVYSDLDNIPEGADPQSAYQIQIDDNSDFSSPIIDSEKVLSDLNIYATNNLDFNQIYYWRVKVWDSNDTESEWSDTQEINNIPTYSCPDFSWNPQFPQEDPETHVITAEFSNLTQCSNPPCSYEWQFTDGLPGTSNDSGPITIQFASNGIKMVTLKITDFDNRVCTRTRSVAVGGAVVLPAPIWKEISPY